MTALDPSVNILSLSWAQKHGYGHIQENLPIMPVATDDCFYVQPKDPGTRHQGSRSRLLLLINLRLNIFCSYWRKLPNMPMMPVAAETSACRHPLDPGASYQICQ